MHCLTHCNLFIHSIVDEYLPFVQLLGYQDGAFMNIIVYCFLERMHPSSVVFSPKSGIAGSKNMLVLSLIDKSITFRECLGQFTTMSNKIWKFQLLHILITHSFVFYILAILVCMSWQHFVVLMCIALKTTCMTFLYVYWTFRYCFFSM